MEILIVIRLKKITLVIVLSSFIWFLYLVWNTFSGIYFARLLLITHPTLLQTSIFWHILKLESLYINVKQPSCEKLQIQQFSLNSTIFYVCFKSKSNIRKLSTSLFVFSDRTIVKTVLLTDTYTIIKHIESKRKISKQPLPCFETLQCFTTASIRYK